MENRPVVLHKLYGVKTNIKFDKLYGISKLVEEFSGMKNSYTKPIVGANAFSHESVIHVSSVLKNPSVYESIEPEFVGRERRLVIGKRSEKSILKHILNSKKMI